MNTYKNFRNYTRYGIVPAKNKDEKNLVPKNSFYKSVHYIDKVIGPVKDVNFGVELKYDYYSYINAMVPEDKTKDHYCNLYTGNRKKDITIPLCTIAIFLPIIIVLLPLYLMFACLKWLAKISKTEPLVNFTPLKTLNLVYYSCKVFKFINTVLSSIFTAIVWVTALVITPLVCACKWTKDKVAASKFTEVEKPEELKINHTVDGNVASKLTKQK